MQLPRVPSGLPDALRRIARVACSSFFGKLRSKRVVACNMDVLVWYMSDLKEVPTFVMWGLCMYYIPRGSNVAPFWEATVEKGCKQKNVVPFWL